MIQVKYFFASLEKLAPNNLYVQDIDTPNWELLEYIMRNVWILMDNLLFLLLINNTSMNEPRGKMRI